MQIQDNGETVEIEVGPCANLAELVDACANRDGRRRAVMGVSVNGCALPEAELDALERFGLDGVERLELSSRDLREVALSSLAHSSEYAGRIGEAVQRAVDLFRRGDADPANQLTAELADSLGMLLSATHAICGALEGRGDELLGREGELVPWLETLVEAQAARDWVSVADYLEFEVAPLIERWQRDLERLHGSVSAGDATLEAV